MGQIEVYGPLAPAVLDHALVGHLSATPATLPFYRRPR
ncbi:hypothetical protein [Micromonospora sp. MW-13]